MRKLVISGADGPQFIDETYRDGRPPRMVSDGEESDVTLMPFYGFGSYDTGEYLNFMRFSVSRRNADYNAGLHSVTWREAVPSTAPAYLKGICAGLNEDEEFGEHGYYTELRRVTDMDRVGLVVELRPGRTSRLHATVESLRGEVGLDGRSAFRAVSFPISARITYDGPNHRFSFNPIATIGDFVLDEDFPEGSRAFRCQPAAGRESVFRLVSPTERRIRSFSPRICRPSRGERGNHQWKILGAYGPRPVPRSRDDSIRDRCRSKPISECGRRTVDHERVRRNEPGQVQSEP